MNISYSHENAEKDAIKMAAIESKMTREVFEHDDNFAFLKVDIDALLEAGQNGRNWGEGAKKVILIGTGGSRFGIEALYYSLFIEQMPELIVLDVLDTNSINKAKKILSKSAKGDVRILIISKSGATPETNIIADELVFSDLNSFDHKKNTAILSESKSSLAEKASKYDLLEIAMQDEIGGRFSIFSSASFFALGVLGIDIELITLRLKRAITEWSANDNFPIIRAENIINHITNGPIAFDIMSEADIYTPLGYWTRQLWAESLGKDAHFEALPTISPISRDCHSVLQLYFGAKPKRFVNFILDDTDNTNVINQAKNAISEALIDEHLRLNIPHTVIRLDTKSGDIIQFMYYEMISLFHVARRLNIDPFGQLAIEHYKNRVNRLIHP